MTCILNSLLEIVSMINDFNELEYTHSNLSSVTPNKRESEEVIVDKNRQYLYFPIDLEKVLTAGMEWTYN